MPLYNENGPSQDEESIDYSPPEVIFGQAPYFHPNPKSYDMWSLGVVFLEMILGTPKVFQISQRTQAVMNSRLKERDPHVRAHAYLFRAFVEYCIFEPEPSADEKFRALARSQQCNETHLAEKIKEFDPTKLGMEDIQGIRLIRVRFPPENMLGTFCIQFALV